MPVVKQKKRGNRGKNKPSSKAKASGDESGYAQPASRKSESNEGSDSWKSPLSEEARERRKPKSILAVLSMAFDFSVEEEWTRVTFPELPTFIFWMRYLVAIAAAIACGIAPVTGLPAIALWAALDLGGVWLYLHKLTMVQLAYGDDDEAGEGSEGSSDFESFKLQSLMMEGVGPSIANFLFFWTFFYNLLHAPVGGSAGVGGGSGAAAGGGALEEVAGADEEEAGEYGEEDYGEEDVGGGGEEL